MSFARSQGIRFIDKKSVIFLYTNNEQLEFEKIYIPFIIVPTKIKTLCRKLKDMSRMYMLKTMNIKKGKF